MPARLKPDSHLEIGHVLFIDVVGYSKLLVNQQREVVQQLNQIVRSTTEFRTAEAENKLVRLPVGDGMALVFFDSPEAPVQCALEISKALQSHPHIRLRMGVNSGPVDAMSDVNDRSNVAGAGINMAQRVMDCGDAGHILLSKRVADDLAQYDKWQSHLHDLGECEVKHGVKVALVNLCTDGLGNRDLPEKVKQLRQGQARAISRRRGITAGAALLLVALLVAGWWIFREQTRRRATAAASFPYKSIAVLPFENLSDNKENAYFADGVQDEILTCLSKVADLKVISRTSVMQYTSGIKRNLREIGKDLGVVHLLEGRVQRAPNRVRVNAQLIDARTDAHLWAQTYDRELADVFAIQSEIAQTIANALHAKILPNEKVAIETPPTSDLVAHDLYLRARQIHSETSINIVQQKKGLPKAQQLLEQAVARDPHFLLAWCLLSRVHGDLDWFGFDHTQARLDLASAAVQTALRLQPDSGEAHLALGLYYYHAFRDYGRARTELASARRTLPNNADVFAYTAYIDRRQGRWEEGTRNLERALELDPRNFLILYELARFYEAQRRYEDELRTYDRALKIVPGDPTTRILRAWVALKWRADIKPFQTMLATLIAEDPSIAATVDHPSDGLCERTAAAAERSLKNFPAEYSISYRDKPKAYWEGVIARWQGDLSKARDAFTAARTEVAPAVEKEPDYDAALSVLGLIDAGLGRKEEAIREGRRACELVPISKDAVDGVVVAVNLAQIYAWTGEKDLAVEQLAATLRVPNDYVSYGELRLSPLWDALRGHPGFEKLVASLAPQDGN